MKAYKAVLPILLSIAVILFLINDISFSIFKQIQIDNRFLFLMAMAFLMAVMRDACYVFRLRLLTEQAISWWKTTEIVLLWEFASAVTPSAIGGGVTGIFLLSNENISIGKSSSIVLITAFLDELVFLLVLPVLFILLGDSMFVFNTACIENKELLQLLPFVKSIVLGVYLFLLLLYGVLIYGLFLNAKSLQKAYQVIAKWPFINRWNVQLNRAGDDIVIASTEARSKSFLFWLKAFMYTLFSWSARYVLAFFIISAMMKGWPNIIDVYGKLYFIRTLSILPLSPGGIGIAELSFLALLCSYMPYGLTKIATLLWRFLSYHVYLILGLILIPIYFNKRKNEKKS